ncbi:hypothetical protein GCM10025857_11720 [Alicyclobacillus contaminans]|uniref:sensor histidine kinase n=1 Tax=Alicyclobacillus contaminans TaxID=392016 RepID=UPI00040AA021|nr:HAMP domain-containing sensor histidine kinase [Alicyclobacillus contaminans]GMA49815.1 hypothetical protein GCM10025857_11720 [Alicyclobacillus contaminans]
MLKRFYLQISSLMILGTVVLLACFGGFVYFELQRYLRFVSEVSLRSEYMEVHDRLMEPGALPDIWSQLDTSDDQGMSMYVLIHTAHADYISPHSPISSEDMLAHAEDGHYTTMMVGDSPYRMFAKTFTQAGQRVLVVTCESTAQAHETLEHVRDVLLSLGVAGILCAVLFHLWIARKALIPAQKTWQAHQEMLAEISHELQTPLATMSAIVSTHVADSAVREDLSREIQEAANLVKDILYLSRLNAEPFEVPLQPVAVSDLTEEVIDRFQPLLQQRHIELAGHAQPGLFVMSTPEMWTRLISVVCKNLADHAEAGSQATWSLTAWAATVQFRLRNRSRKGIGEAPADATRGFGMKIARRILQEMRGRMDIERDGPWVITTVTVPRKVKL